MEIQDGAQRCSRLRKAGVVVLGISLIASCALLVSWIGDNEDGDNIETISTTTDIAPRSSTSYIADVFPKYHSFDPSNKQIRMMEEAERAAGIRDTLHLSQGGNLYRGDLPNGKARTQSKYIPARYNPDVSEEDLIKEFQEKFSAIVKELGSMEDMLSCAAKCTDDASSESSDEHTKGGVSVALNLAPTQTTLRAKAGATLKSQQHAWTSNLPAGKAHSEPAPSPPFNALAEDTGPESTDTSASAGEGEVQEVSMECLASCGVPIEMLNASAVSRIRGGERLALDAKGRLAVVFKDHPASPSLAHTPHSLTLAHTQKDGMALDVKSRGEHQMPGEAMGRR
eukprot:CAMPEP_0181300440 /NCGR_PEP_ID=MMETSP1101-20121128/6890_1 /TAXON_ID=46948 /ORGANISM="Rhodomonas abbreviata, Strain Caron Lab Isolate" /LENGTH=339 /DNA_ID=CAMNT_0023405675 /DNA_START=108 /DNA_END=1124 /DNA_ORIENTATION=+